VVYFIRKGDLKMRKTVFLPRVLLAITVISVIYFAACTVAQIVPNVAPGTIEIISNEDMPAIEAAHLAADPDADEMVIYYYRKDDPNYVPWAMWIWALGVGEGSDNFPVHEGL
jgi:hypothetical protein